ncbi:ATP-binding protein [Thermosyntropha sp.]|uniref:ATP-binding protein n=1 Tax=Thermosyntropha sp. TaxID=2740820 RepID=UPI0025CDFA0A|nr:ATP-binding protein [Thermosyntropha sp.]MBO8158234.1 P-loop NTPase [Thermosyntropha sp.]
MIIAVASGKGGTGKTTVATNLAYYRARDEKVFFMDLDVEEPNAAVFLKPEIEEEYPAVKKVPQIDEEKCKNCGKCARACAFNALAAALDKILVFPEMCHSCGLCSKVCPFDAIREIDYEIGKVFRGNSSGQILFYEGKLNIGETSTPEVISAVKKNIVPGHLTVLDAPPGASCSVMETLEEVDFCLLVAEPTPFGLSDLKLMVELMKEMSIPSGIIINQWQEENLIIDRFAEEKNLPVLLRIPFDRRIAHAYSKGELFSETIEDYQNIFEPVVPGIKELIKK